MHSDVHARDLQPEEPATPWLPTSTVNPGNYNTWWNMADL